MILEIQCSSVEMNSIMYIVKSIMTTLMIIAPILAIISLSILLVRKVMKPDEEKSTKKIKNVFLALAILFFIPTIMNVLMYVLGDSTDISSCYTTAQKIDPNSNYIPIEDEKNNAIVNADDFYDGYPHQLDFSCKSKEIQANFSCETIYIVERHYKEFNYYTKQQVIAGYGGFDNWIKALRGYFEEYYMKDPKEETKAKDFQKIYEYVFGLMYIHGFDYYNGTTMDNFDDGTKYCKWGGKCIYLKDIAEAKRIAAEKGEEPKIDYPVGSEDAFYPGTMIYGDNGSMNGKRFDQGISGMNMTTNCNNSVDMVYYKAKILGTKERPYSSADYMAQARDSKNKIVTSFSDAQIGDIIHFFEVPVDPGNPSTWQGWGHVAYIGEIDYEKGIITAYDGGSYFTSNRNHKWTFSRNNTTSSLFGFEGWAIIHLVDLK